MVGAMVRRVRRVEMNMGRGMCIFVVGGLWFDWRCWCFSRVMKTWSCWMIGANLWCDVVGVDVFDQVWYLVDSACEG